MAHHQNQTYNNYINHACLPEIPPIAGDGGFVPHPLSNGEIVTVGFVMSHIRCFDFQESQITAPEMVSLIRFPLEQDPEAIIVYSANGFPAGYIESCAAQILSPLIDQFLITVEGIVPNLPAEYGTGCPYTLACQVHIFTAPESYQMVKSEIISNGLDLLGENDADLGFPDVPVINLSDETNDHDLDELKWSDILNLVENGTKGRGFGGLMIEPPNEVIVSELFPHQKEGLAWLVARENSGELPPLWVDKGDGSYHNKTINFTTYRRPDPIRGGIFADDMGMGKTLTLLSLIALDRFGPGGGGSGNNIGGNVSLKRGCDHEMVSSSRKKGKSTWGKGKNNGLKVGSSSNSNVDHSMENQKIVGGISNNERCVSGCTRDSVEPRVTKSTLVVCPPSVFATWMTQVEEHTKPNALKVYLYHGERTRDVTELQKYDLVLTTYSTLGIEATMRDSPLFKLKWWRVILDEAHLIKNAHSQQSMAVNNLVAWSRWAVTGTPIQNGTFDLFSLMVFLRLYPFSVKSEWISLVQRPLANGNSQGFSRLQTIMAKISLRRTKEASLIGLPPKIIETCFVELSAEERELYDRLEQEARNLIRYYISSVDRVEKNYTTILGVLTRLRQICINSALCPPDLFASFSTEIIGDVCDHPHLMEKMVRILGETDEFDCPICLSSPLDIVITSCAHIFCKSCILRALKRGKSSCPMCRKPISGSNIFLGPPEEGDRVTAPNMSTKMSVLLRHLTTSKEQDPSIKSVVFSQFRKMLKFLEEPLKAKGFKVLRLDGSMDARKRAQVIRAFGARAPDAPTILLASLMASGTGINLTAASRVYMLEPWWNRAMEEQAMDRVHRIGQTKEVRVVRLIARHSIEERVMALQAKKKVAVDAFVKKAGGGGGQRNREISIDDLRTLMSL